MYPHVKLCNSAHDHLQQGPYMQAG